MLGDKTELEKYLRAIKERTKQIDQRLQAQRETQGDYDLSIHLCNESIKDDAEQLLEWFKEGYFKEVEDPAGGFE